MCKLNDILKWKRIRVEYIEKKMKLCPCWSFFESRELSSPGPRELHCLQLPIRRDSRELEKFLNWIFVHHYVGFAWRELMSHRTCEILVSKFKCPKKRRAVKSFTHVRLKLVRKKLRNLTIFANKEMLTRKDVNGTFQLLQQRTIFTGKALNLSLKRKKMELFISCQTVL